MFKYIIKLFFSFLVLQTSLFSQDINIDKIVQQANKSDKNVIIYLHRIGCSYCNTMGEFTLDDDDVIDYIDQNFKLVHINVSLEDTITFHGKVTGGICFAKDIGYNFYPSTIFLDESANVKYSTVGYRNEVEFLHILKYVHTGTYKNMDLKKYKKIMGYTINEDYIVDERKRAR